MAFGHRAYAFCAANIAKSIKHFSDVPITLAIEAKIKYQLSEEDYRFFDKVIEIGKEDVTNSKGFDPCLAKVSIYDYLQYDENLYLDVDAVCLKDVKPLIKELSQRKKFYCTDVRGVGGRDDNIHYSIWADNEDIWDCFKLDDFATLPGIQSSFCFIKKNKKAEAFFNKVKSNYVKGVFPMDKLRRKWGGAMPDELMFSATAAQKGLDVSSGVKPIFYGTEHDPRGFEELAETYYFSSIHGLGKGDTTVKVKYLEWYDRLIMKYCKKWGMRSIYNRSMIMPYKWANKVV